MIWIALFSKSGSEIVDLSKKMDRYPDLVLTNNDGPFDRGIYLASHVVVSKHESLMYHLKVHAPEWAIVTLHGYMRIIPPEVCGMKVYNGHPGAIHKYPELKGKDPQARSYKKYPDFGCVIHRVTAGVDEGPVLASAVQMQNNEDTLEEYIKRHKEISLSLWTAFFEQQMWRVDENCARSADLDIRSDPAKN